MKIIQSPEICSYKELETEPHTIFLAGGITNCPNWQSYISDRFKRCDGNVIVFNPRKVTDFSHTGEEGAEQILWEDRHLHMSTHLLFYFPAESICPIGLFELGKYATIFSLNPNINAIDRIFIACHPHYPRRFDIEHQIPLIIPDIQIDYTLDDLFNRTAKALGIESRHKVTI